MGRSRSLGALVSLRGVGVRSQLGPSLLSGSFRVAKRPGSLLHHRRHITTWSSNTRSSGGPGGIARQAREFVDLLACDRKFTSLDDYHQLTTEIVLSYPDGQRMLDAHRGSVTALLSVAHPYHDWLPWRFNRVPDGYWSNMTNQKKFVEWMRKQAGLTESVEQLYTVTVSTIASYGGRGVLTSQFTKYNDSPSALIMAVYPEHDWLPWKFKSVPQRWWSNIENQRRFLEWLRGKLGLAGDLENLYELTADVIVENDGAGLMHHRESVPKLLAAVYPNHRWNLWLFKNAPARWWTVTDEPRKYLDWLRGNVFGKGAPWESLYTLNLEHFASNSGTLMLKQLEDGNIASFVVSTVPEHNWQPWKFSTGPPSAYWQIVKNQSAFLNCLAKEASAQRRSERRDDELEELYLLTTIGIQKAGGAGLLIEYNYNIQKLVSTAIPNYEWLPWRFLQNATTTRWWGSAANQKTFMVWLRRKLELNNSLEQLYPLSASTIVRLSAPGWLEQFYKGSASNFVQAMYPQHRWMPWRFTQAPKGWWSSVLNQRHFMDKLRQEHGLTDSLEQLYLATRHTIVNFGGGGLLKHFHDSPALLIASAYPEHEWLPWKFNRLAEGWWDKLENQRRFMAWFLQIAGVRDRPISKVLLRRHGGAPLLRLYGNSLSRIAEQFLSHKLVPVDEEQARASSTRSTAAKLAKQDKRGAAAPTMTSQPAQRNPTMYVWGRLIALHDYRQRQEILQSQFGSAGAESAIA